MVSYRPADAMCPATPCSFMACMHSCFTVQTLTLMPVIVQGQSLRIAGVCDSFARLPVLRCTCGSCLLIHCARLAESCMLMI